jgi:acyl carrier protein
MDWQSDSTANRDFEPPSTPTEQALSEIWSPFFENQPLGRQADFFQLGGDSLTAVGVSSEVEHRLGVSLELSLFADHPILSDLAAALDVRRASSAGQKRAPLRRIPRDQPLVVSYQQERTWKYSQDPVTSRGYTLPFTYRISGDLDAGLLRQSLNFLIRRHEILRTTFTIQPDGQLTQSVHPWTEASFEFIDVSAALDPEAMASETLAARRKPTFDFAAGPLLRFTLLQLNPTEFQLLRVNQHIISDGPSWAIFLDELALVYGSLLRGEPLPLREDEPLQYADYAAWQRNLFQPGTVCWNATVTWWKQHLADPPKPAPYPFQRSVPVLDAEPSSGNVPCAVDIITSNRLDEVARDCRTTPFIAQLASAVALLSAQMGSRDMIWGHYTAGRDTLETQQIFGFFGNLITLRFRFDPAMNFREWLASVRQTVHEAEENSGPGYEDLCQTLLAQKVTVPEIQLIAKLPSETVEIPLGGATLASMSRRRSNGTAAMPWGFSLLLSVETPPRRLYATFDAGIYDPVLVEKFLADLVILFGEVACQPQVPLGDLLSNHMRRGPHK